MRHCHRSSIPACLSCVFRKPQQLIQCRWGGLYSERSDAAGNCRCASAWLPAGRYCVAATGLRTINMKRLERRNPLYGLQRWVAYIWRRGRGTLPNLAQGSRPRCGSSRRSPLLCFYWLGSEPVATLQLRYRAALPEV